MGWGSAACLVSRFICVFSAYALSDYHINVTLLAFPLSFGFELHNVSETASYSVSLMVFSFSVGMCIVQVTDSCRRIICYGS